MTHDPYLIFAAVLIIPTSVYCIAVFVRDVFFDKD